MIDWTKPIELMDGTPVERKLWEPGRPWVFALPNNVRLWVPVSEIEALIRNRAEAKAEPTPATPEQPTLRDRFAMAALNGELASQAWDGGNEYNTDEGMSELAGWCYDMADAMMEARK